MPDRMFRLLFIIALIAGADRAFSANRLYSVHVDNPRTYGYHAGDSFSQSATIRVAPDYEIVPATVPKAGDFSPWLKVSGVDISSFVNSDIRTYRLEIRYQITGFSPESTTISTPRFDLRLESGREKIPIIIQPLRIRISEMVPPLEQLAIADIPLAPALGPALRVTRYQGPMVWLCFFLAALLALGLGWSIYRGTTPKRPLRPFHHALQDVKRLLSANPPQLLEARRRIHQAFNQRWGRTVFESSLDGFYVTNPQFQDKDEDIRRFFRESTSLFFAETPSPRGEAGNDLISPPGQSESTNVSRIDSLITLAQQCAKLEKRRVS